MSEETTRGVIRLKTHGLHPFSNRHEAIWTSHSFFHLMFSLSQYFLSLLLRFTALIWKTSSADQKRSPWGDDITTPVRCLEWDQPGDVVSCRGRGRLHQSPAQKASHPGGDAAALRHPSADVLSPGFYQLTRPPSVWQHSSVPSQLQTV